MFCNKSVYIANIMVPDLTGFSTVQQALVQCLAGLAGFPESVLCGGAL